MTDPVLAEIERWLRDGTMPGATDWELRTAVARAILEREAGLRDRLAHVEGGPADEGTLRDCTDCGRAMVWQNCGGDYAGWMICPHCTAISRDSLLAENAALKKDHEADQCALRIGISEHARKDAELELLREVDKAARRFAAEPLSNGDEHSIHARFTDALAAIDTYRKARG